MTTPAVRRWGGLLSGGGAWALEVPEAFGGIVCLYSAGYGADAGTVALAGGEATRELLLSHGFGVAGSRTVASGWIIEDALVDQAETAQEVRRAVGEDVRIIAWGHSMGGLITTGLAERAAGAINGAVALCGSVAGAVPMLNQGLDAAFALAVLCFPDDDLEIVDVVSDDRRRLERGREAIETARRSPAGRARVALAAALAQIPTWTVDNMFSAGEVSPEPEPDDLDACLRNQAAVLPYVAFSPRGDLERRAGGRFSWNTGVDYTEQLRMSGFADLVAETYQREGVDLAADLETLAGAPRVRADDGPVAYMEENLTPIGELEVPMLAVAVTGDFAPTLTQSSAYADLVAESGRSALLRQVYVHAPGHCGSLTEAHAAAGIEAVAARLDAGVWVGASARELTQRMSALADPVSGSETPAPFVEVTPGHHVRPYPRSARRSAKPRG